MLKKVTYVISAIFLTISISSCGMMMTPMAKMVGMGDKLKAMENMDAVMKDMTPDQRKSHMMKKQEDMLAYGGKLFNDASLGTNGQNCASCHPDGTTTGGEAEIPKNFGKGPWKMPIPNLIGAKAKFPKYKVPNDRVITLQQMNNNCIKMFLKGKPLELRSRESIALNMYVGSLSNGEEVKIQDK